LLGGWRGAIGERLGAAAGHRGGLEGLVRVAIGGGLLGPGHAGRLFAAPPAPAHRLRLDARDPVSALIHGEGLGDPPLPPPRRARPCHGSHRRRGERGPPAPPPGTPAPTANALALPPARRQARSAVRRFVPCPRRSRARPIRHRRRAPCRRRSARGPPSPTPAA